MLLVEEGFGTKDLDKLKGCFIQVLESLLSGMYFLGDPNASDPQEKCLYPVESVR